MVPIDGKYIKEWLILGPFFPDDLEKDFLADVGGEANIQPQEGDTVITAEGKTLMWQRYQSKADIVNMQDSFGEHEYATAYAFCVLQSEVTGDVEIRLGSDSGVAVWINGERVHLFPDNRSLDLDQDIFYADLKAGANHCLVKVFHRAQDWAFAMRALMLPLNRAVISGTISDENGNPIPDADICLERNGYEIDQTTTDNSGCYRLNISPVPGLYDICATSGNLGDWQLGIQLGEGEHRTLNFTLKEAISIEGTLLMLDDVTPHTAVPVQAMRDGEVIVTVLSDKRLSDKTGKYQFINLKPGQYQLRCQVLGGYVYYKTADDALPFTCYDSPDIEADAGEVLSVEQGRTLKNIDFCFASFKKGTWKNYTCLDGLANDRVVAIYRDPDGVMWFGTWNGGVSRYDGKEFVNFTTEDGLASNRVHAIYPDADGVMWFGTWGGVSRYDGEKFVTFTTKDGLAHDSVLAIHRDPDGMMWFGTGNYFGGGGGGVSRFVGEEFGTF
nr:carboxypeptidase regulatory-like domain-containing protein [bacterium]